MKNAIALVLAFFFAAFAANAQDVYDHLNNRLSIAEVEIVGTGVALTNVVLDIGTAKVISSAPPRGAKGHASFNPATGRLALPAVAIGQNTFWNVLVQLGANAMVISHTGTKQFSDRLAVSPSSYGQKILAGNAIGPQALPSDTWLGSAVGFGDFFGEGGWSMVTHSLRYYRGTPGDSPIVNGQLKFWRKGASGWIDNTSEILADQAGCLHARKAVIVDFNGDGRPDVFMACTGFDASPFPGEQSLVLLSQPDGSYQKSLLNVSGYFHGASAADVTGDGYPDIVVTNKTGLFFLINNQDGTFRQDTTRTNLPYGYFTAELIDVGGTGKFDLFVAGQESSPLLYRPAMIVKNDGNGGFINTQQTVFPRLPGFGMALDAVFEGEYTYLARTTDESNNYYQAAAFHKVHMPTLTGTSIYQHSGPYAHGLRSIFWIIPFRSSIAALDTIFDVSVPK